MTSIKTDPPPFFLILFPVVEIQTARKNKNSVLGRRRLLESLFYMQEDIFGTVPRRK